MRPGNRSALRAIIAFGVCIVAGCGHGGSPHGASASGSVPEYERAAEAVKLQKQALERLAPADAAYRRALVAGLRSDNPYERQLALERLSAAPWLIDVDTRLAFVSLLSETEKLYSEPCASLIDNDRGPVRGQGIDLEIARCEYQGGTSNGSRAGKLLYWALQSSMTREKIPEAIASFVREHPSTVEAVIASLGDGAKHAAWAGLLELPKAADGPSHAALLRFTIIQPCGGSLSDETVRPVVEQMRAADARVTHYASLVLLRLETCDQKVKGLEPHTQAASAAVAARLGDLKDKTIVGEVAWLGAAAGPFVPALLRRYDAVRDERPQILSAIGAAGPAAAAAVPKLVGLLGDRSLDYLHDEVLDALGRIGSAAAPAKAAIIRRIARDSALTTPGLAALASILVRLTGDEFAELNRGYRERCKDAGSVPNFSFGRDDRCGKEAIALATIAEVSGLSFKRAD